MIIVTVLRPSELLLPWFQIHLYCFLQMTRAIHVTNAGRFLLTRAILRDISNMCVQIILAELGSVLTVEKRFSIHAT